MDVSSSLLSNVLIYIFTCLLGNVLRKHQAVACLGGGSNLGGDHMLGGGSSLGRGNILGRGSRLGGGGMLESGSRLWGGSRLGQGTIRGWVGRLWGSHNQVGCGSLGGGGSRVERGNRPCVVCLWALMGRSSYWNDQNGEGYSTHSLLLLSTLSDSSRHTLITKILKVHIMVYLTFW